MRTVLLSVFLSILMLISRPASAATAQDSLKEIIQWYKNAAQGLGQELRINGETTFLKSPDPKLQQARISDIDLISPSGFRMHIGDVLVNMSPSTAKSEQDAWMISAALPRALAVYDAANDHIADVNIGAQRLGASWSPLFQTFLRLDADYRQISFKMKNSDAYAFSVAQFRNVTHLVKNTDQIWTGARLFETKNLSAQLSGKGEQGRFELNVDRLRSSGTSYDRSLQAVQALHQEIVSSRQENIDHTLQASKLFQRTLEALPQRYTGGLTLEGVKFQSFPPANSGLARRRVPITLALSSLSSKADMTGIHQQEGNGRFTAHLSGLTMTGVPQPLDGLVPEKANIDISLQNLPSEEVSKILVNFLQSTMTPGVISQSQDARSVEMQKLLAQLPPLMSKAGTHLIIADTNVNTPDLRVALTGDMKVSSSSSLLMAGDITLVVGGFDEVIKKYRTLGSADPAFNQYLQGLIPIQLAGQLGRDEQNRSTRIYNLVVAPEGSVTLNGTDIAKVKALMQGQPVP